MTFVVTYQIDSDPGQTDNHSITGQTWSVPSLPQTGYPGLGTLTITSDQIEVIAQGFCSALQASIRAANGIPNAVVTLVSVVDQEQVEQDTTLYQEAGS